jgi:hypothetical protein
MYLFIVFLFICPFFSHHVYFRTIMLVSWVLARYFLPSFENISRDFFCILIEFWSVGFENYSAVCTFDYT